MANILVIDDDELAREAVKISLEEHSHTITTTSDGEYGITLAKEEGYDLVITDLIMPDTEGIQILLELKQDNSEAKVLVISGGGRNSPELYLESAIDLGADGVLAKPFSATELTTAVNQIIEE